MVRILVGFGWIFAIFIQRRRMRVSLQKQHGEPLQKHAWPGWNKHKQSASVAVSEPHCTADMCSVNCLSINGRESPLYSRTATYEVFLGGYSRLHWRMIIWLFTYAMWPVNAKKTFPLQFCEIFIFFELPEKPTHASVKTFLRYIWEFLRNWRVSIRHIFNLQF